MAEVRLVPCRSDNYAVLVHAGDTTILVDAPDEGEIRTALAQTGWRLTHILVTHHHSDHVVGIPGVRGEARVLGPAAEAAKIGVLDEGLADGAEVTLGALRVRCLATPGHTAGPLSYHLPAEGIAFTGDTLFAMGCGRLFEGDAATMWRSLATLRDWLPEETEVFCGHEYTLKNAQYAASVLPDDVAVAERLRVIAAARDRGEPTVPTTMAAERATNPFLRADEAGVAEALGMAGADPVAVFARLRTGRDQF